MSGGPHASGHDLAPASAANASRVLQHLDNLTKPPGSLGALERVAYRVAMIYGDPPPSLGRARVLVFAADHGVACNHVSAYPQAVTAEMCRNIANGGAAINAIAASVGANVTLIDVGVAADISAIGAIRHMPVARGTSDLAAGPAMTRAQVDAAMSAGAAAASACTEDIVVLGELGIANTTSAAALSAALLNRSASDVTGRGTGISEDGWRNKCALVSNAVSRIPATAPPMTVLQELGGFEIAAMAGAAIAIARSGRAVILDGVISTAAALLAARLEPSLPSYLIAGHCSIEPAHQMQLDALGLEPILRLGLRLGEGTGAALALPIVRAAAALLREMATFESAGVSTAN